MERFGDWTLEHLVAVGGIAEVWRVVAPRDHLVIKRMHTHLARNADARAQFTIEQHQALELPRHPNVVHGVDSGLVDDRQYIALERAPGEELRRVAAPPGVLPRERVLAIVRAACEAAAHIHAHGWVHGDINPANLMVDARPEGDGVVLVDLGVIREIGAGGSVRGTHAYMAPEQVRGEAWTPATDVFALGVVLWELAAGKRLFHRGPTWLSAAAVVEEPAPALPDPALDAIVQAALAKAPGARIPTARDLAHRLAEAP